MIDSSANFRYFAVLQKRPFILPSVICGHNQLNTLGIFKYSSKDSKKLQTKILFTALAGLSHGEILLITDGMHFAQSEKAGKELRNDGYKLSVLGVGTHEGAPIPLRNGVFLKDASGSIVVSELETDPLRNLAQAGNGLYRTLSVNDEDVKTLLAPPSVDRLENEVEETVLKADLWQEEGPWLLLVLLPLAALAFRRGYLCVIIILLAPLPQPGHALDWAGLWSRPDQQASRALQRGDAAGAAELFAQPAWRGAAHYRAGQYEQTTDQRGLKPSLQLPPPTVAIDMPRFPLTLQETHVEQ